MLLNLMHAKKLKTIQILYMKVGMQKNKFEVDRDEYMLRILFKYFQFL